ncbi:TPA: DUF814 domain-containing protein [Candidatus Woesearchaeota archaeon]|nr:DUF814 domain-containing protein [Candidatus Woesearchaeota archaeon]
MNITLFVDKSLEENAALHYDRAKKVAKKAEGARESLEQNRKKLAELERKRDKELGRQEEQRKAVSRKKEWYEKFRWLVSSEGFLVIGGRDATSNEVIIKKHAEANDLVFHTDMAGSPFFIVKAEGKSPGEATLREAADATCTFSRAWKLGLSNSPVFSVSPEQISKKAQAGEYLTKGAFMIYGKTAYIENAVNLAIGATEDGKIMAGPLNAVRKHCSSVIVISQGDGKPSDIAKTIRHRLKAGTIDEIIRALPSGGMKIKG